MSLSEWYRRGVETFPPSALNEFIWQRRVEDAQRAGVDLLGDPSTATMVAFLVGRKDGKR